MTRILFVASNYEPQHVQQITGKLGRYVTDRKWQMKVLTNKTKQNEHIEKVTDNVPLVRLESVSMFPGYMLNNRAGYDLIFSFIFRNVNCFLPVLKALFGKKYIIKMEGLPNLPKLGLNPRRYLGRFFNFYLPLKYADCVIYESERIRERLKKIVKNGKLLYFPNGIPTGYYDQMIKKFSAANIADKKKNPYILCVARIIKQKGLEYLFSAFSKIHQRYPEWRIKVVGPVVDEEYKLYIDSEIRKYHITEKIEFTGFVSEEKLVEYHLLSDIFCLPSISEGFSQVVLDAMYLKTPVVYTDNNENSYLIEKYKCGILTKPGDEEGLALALDKLMSDSGMRKEYGTRACNAVKNLSWERLLDGFWEFAQKGLVN